MESSDKKIIAHTRITTQWAILISGNMESAWVNTQFFLKQWCFLFVDLRPAKVSLGWRPTAVYLDVSPTSDHEDEVIIFP